MIVPVYNVEQYLNRCVDSIIAQTYDDLQIILVDDGATDLSGAICDEYAKKDNRIEVIHQENQGLSAARNCGIERAVGEYITFVDSDDYIAACFVEKLVHIAEKEKCGLVQCDFEIGSSNNYSFSSVGKYEIMDKRSAFRTRKTKIISCAKLYRSELFSELRFPVGRINEDEFVTYQTIYNAGEIAVLNDRLYYYYQSGESITRKQRTIEPLDFIDAMDERIDFFRNLQEPMLELISRKEKSIRLMLCYIKCKNNRENQNDVGALLKLFRKEFRKSWKAPMNLKERGSMVVFFAVPNLSARIVSILK